MGLGLRGDPARRAPRSRPGALTLGRLLVGSLVLGAVLAVRGFRRPARRDWPLLLVCGLLWFGVYNIALNAAEQRVDAGTTAMLVNVGPLLIALLAGLLLGEGFPRHLVTGSLVAFAGVVRDRRRHLRARAPGRLASLLCLVAAVGYAVGVVAQKPLLARLPALEVTWLACTIGAVACLPFAPQLVAEAGDARLSTLGWVVYLGAFPTAIAFTTWAYALSHTTAGRMGATTYLVPPVTIVLAWAAAGRDAGRAGLRGRRPVPRRGRRCPGVRDGGRRGEDPGGRRVDRPAGRPAGRPDPGRHVPGADGRPGLDGRRARDGDRRGQVHRERAPRPAGGRRPARARSGRAGTGTCGSPRPAAAQLVESLAVQAGPGTAPRSLRAVTAGEALARGRTCYDHLAGRLGVAVMDALADRDLVSVRRGVALTDAGERWLHDLGVDVGALRAGSRPLVRTCLDWTERRPHLAGAAGAALCTRLTDNGWVERTTGRAVRVTEPGHRALHRLLGLTRDDLGGLPR